MELLDQLTLAIQDRLVVRLGYARKRDELITLHFVAPIDVRPGWSRMTESTLYLWAYCFDEQKVEMHLLDRIRSVTITAEAFATAPIFARWPPDWPLPDSWVIPRDW